MLRSLYEYVQQNAAEICSAWDAQHPVRRPTPNSSDDDWPPKWWRAQEVYERATCGAEKQLGDVAARFLDATTLSLCGVTSFEQRPGRGARHQVLSCSRPARPKVPLERSRKHIESFAATASAQRPPCPAGAINYRHSRKDFVELYQDEDHDIHPTARVSSGDSKCAAPPDRRTGYTAGKSGSDDWTSMPRRLLAQYQAVPASLNERLSGLGAGPLARGRYYRLTPTRARATGRSSCRIRTRTMNMSSLLSIGSTGDRGTTTYRSSTRGRRGAASKTTCRRGKYRSHGQISNDGFAMATDERRKKGYAIQRSCKCAGRVLGYSNFEFVDSDDRAKRHRLLEERGDVPASDSVDARLAKNSLQYRKLCARSLSILYKRADAVSASFGGARLYYVRICMYVCMYIGMLKRVCQRYFGGTALRVILADGRWTKHRNERTGRR